MVKETLEPGVARATDGALMVIAGGVLSKGRTKPNCVWVNCVPIFPARSV